MKRRIYYCPRRFRWTDPKTGKTVTVPRGYPSDGASGPANDVFSYGWFAHDVLRDRGTWDDGTACTASDASRVLSNILFSEGRWIRAGVWYPATWAWTALKDVLRIKKPGMRIPQPEKAGLVEYVDRPLMRAIAMRRLKTYKTISRNQ